jgi:CHAT domain-containing protein
MNSGSVLSFQVSTRWGLSPAAGSTLHPDEALHIAAALQYLGYRHVLATMWNIADTPAPLIADDVYSFLTSTVETDIGEPTADLAAEALHHAISALRRARLDDPLLWAPYIHIGT